MRSLFVITATAFFLTSLIYVNAQFGLLALAALGIAGLIELFHE